MRRTLRAPYVWLLAALPWWGSGCAYRASEPAVTKAEAAWDGRAFSLLLDASEDVARFEQLDASGAGVLRRWTFTPGTRKTLKLEPPPPEGPLRGRLVLRDASVREIALSVPPRPAHAGALTLALPLGLPGAAAEAQEALLPAGQTVAGAVSALFEGEAGGTVRLELEPPAGWTLEAQAAREGERIWRETEHAQVFERPVQGGDRIEFRFTLRAPGASREAETFRARLRLPQGATLEAARTLRALSAAELARTVRIVEHALPTDGFGRQEVSRRQGLLRVPSAWERRLRGALGLPQAWSDGEAPFAYARVTVEHDLPGALAVDVRGVVREAESERAAAGFAPPAKLGRAGETWVEPLIVPPGARREAIFPIYLQPDVLPGPYRRVAEVRLFGSETVLAADTAALEVASSARLPLLLTLAAALLTLVALPLLLLGAPRILRGFSTVELIQLALFGAATFVLVGVPARLISVALFAVLPVLSPFILGLYGTVCAEAIVAAAVRLVPRPGVALLVGGVRFLLNGIVFGGFSPLDLLYIVPVLLSAEALLWLCGVTRGKPSAPRIVAAFGLLGAGGAAFTLALESALFRLFFADWYVLLYVALNGCAYPLLGAWLGTKLGADLTRVAE
ncbi:MAG: hypothetical protein HS116_10690 [Planctomycetes bacterium]|nr:hypothetical protein [Planctomycetota bacterium]